MDQLQNDAGKQRISQHKQTLLLMLTALMLSAAIVYAVFPLVRHWYTGSPIWTVQAPATCDLHQSSCRVDVPGGWVELALTPNPIELLTPMTVQVNTSGLNPASVQVDFSSPDMYMGYNRPNLQPTGNTGEFSGVTSLGICILETMLWEAKVLLDVSGGTGVVSFYFPTTRRF